MGDLKDTLMKFTKGVTKTSGELLKSTKLSLALASEEDKLKQIYMEIGKKVHEIYQYGGSLGKFFDEKYLEIQQTEAGIQSLRDQMDTVKGVRTCPKCGASVERTAGFCPKCGTQMDLAASVPTARAPAVRPAPVVRPDPVVKPAPVISPAPAANPAPPADPAPFPRQEKKNLP
jgi:ribosomal protein S27AE